MPIQAIIVDIGGVLLLREDFATHSTWEERLGLEPGGLIKAVHWSGLAAQAALGTVTTAEVWKDVGARLALTAAELQQLRQDFDVGEYLNTQFVAYLQRLRPAYRTAIISNAWLDTREAVIVKYDIGDLVDTIIISAEEGMGKPDPRIYRLAAARLGVRPDESLFVDDVPGHVAGARAAGMLVVHFRNTAQAITEIESHLNRERGQTK